MNETLDTVLEIFHNAIGEHKLVKLVFGERESQLDDSYMEDEIYKQYIDNNLFLKAPSMSLGYTEDFETTALAVKIMKSAGVKSLHDIMFNPDKHISAIGNANLGYTKGNWFIVYQDLFSFEFLEDASDVLHKYANNSGDYYEYDTIEDSIDYYERSDNIDKFEEFAEKIAKGDTVYNSVDMLFREFELDNDL